MIAEGGYGGFYESRARETEKLVEVAVDCGIEKSHELFDKIVGIVYGDSNERAEMLKSFMDAMARVVETANEKKEYTAEDARKFVSKNGAMPSSYNDIEDGQ